MKQCYSSTSNDTNEDPLESYGDYYKKISTTLEVETERVIQRIQGSSLSERDKKQCLVDMLHKVQTELFLHT